MTTVDLAHQELLIGGSWTGAKSGRAYEQSFPYTGDQVGWAAAAGREDAHAAADAAGAAFPEWSRSAPAVRRAMGVRAPAGVVVGIAPWNAPVILSTRAVATPLAYANTVVLKASELCPHTHAAVVSALVDAGLPAGVINLVTNAPEDAEDVVDELIAHPATRRINFTGSTKVGRIIAEKAGRHLKRVLLELGGKAPMIVLRDADLDRAAAAASFGAFFHQGQICMSTERIVVDRTVADSLAERLAERARALPVGDPRDASTAIGPLINRAGRAVLPADRAHRRHAGDARVRGGVIRTAGHGGAGRRARRRGGRRQRHRLRAVGGRAALEEFTELRWITVQSLPRHYPI